MKYIQRIMPTFTCKGIIAYSPWTGCLRKPSIIPWDHRKSLEFPLKYTHTHTHTPPPPPPGTNKV